ncbi:acyl CoA binding protein-domain-containing protein [Hygrophoropsis aurantiaca]|uniref:Acyl CoA binding protein-domain-containing protein n=1 Tax=Hygrophoropsis aurantiaca TaxID=72124 RepID=A0ACB8ATI1_9AGAM|nr:acyl CoA binding protein-domain-containing protein [Hygrophoropsis aurantiaca]
MDSRQLIDAQFDRAVEIIQSLPKTGPIQTGYDEKLTMYSLYKQATIGNVKSPRPGMFDMLGRAKWDAWAKHKDLDPYEAKWLYVDALLKTLNKYSDKTIARDLVQELESYGGDPSNLVLSHSLSQSRGSSSSGSTASQEPTPFPQKLLSPQHSQNLENVHRIPSDGDDESSGNESGDEARELPSLGPAVRPQSSMSSRYRTPLSGSFAMSPPLRHASVPPMQPMPGFETPSAFADPLPSSIPSSSVYPSTASYPPGFTSQSPAHFAHPSARSHTMPLPTQQFGVPLRPPTRLTLEQAVENVQAHLAALTERIDTLESSLQPHKSNVSLPTRGSSGRGSPANIRAETFEWDIEDMGMWSYILKPVVRIMAAFKQLAIFFAQNEHRSPVLIVVRRLCLDISFTLAVLAVLRVAWRRSNTRRREINAALMLLWDAFTGSRRTQFSPNRRMVSRAV